MSASAWRHSGADHADRLSRKGVLCGCGVRCAGAQKCLWFTVPDRVVAELHPNTAVRNAVVGTRGPGDRHAVDKDGHAGVCAWLPHQPIQTWQCDRVSAHTWQHKAEENHQTPRIKPGGTPRSTSGWVGAAYTVAALTHRKAPVQVVDELNPPECDILHVSKRRCVRL